MPALIMAACSSTSWGQCELDKLSGNGGQVGDHFANALSLDGDYLAIGSYMDDFRGSASGSVFVFRRKGPRWLQAANFVSAQTTNGDLLGRSVCVAGERLIVGAHLAESGAHPFSETGRAYIFERTDVGWIEQIALEASDPAGDAHFGWSVAIDGDWAAVAEPKRTLQYTHQGVVYMFRRTAQGWQEEQVLSPSENGTYYNFGYRIAMRGDRLFASGWASVPGGAIAPVVYIFERSDSGWTEEGMLAPTPLVGSDLFGRAIDVHNDVVIIGAKHDDELATNAGAAYVFRHANGSWTQEAKLVASDGTYMDYFGSSVAIDDDFAVVGAIFDYVSGIESGSAYIFRRDGALWTEQIKLTLADAVGYDWYGTTAAIDGAHAVVGASRHGTGAAYLYATRAFGDSNADGAVSLADFSTMPACYFGPEMISNVGCDHFDHNCDWDIDLEDFARFQAVLTCP
ncbi:MAG: hypothetical protein GY778_06350 [bacterium]|nr:hypothetical protein [bacterium]